MRYYFNVFCAIGILFGTSACIANVGLWNVGNTAVVGLSADGSVAALNSPWSTLQTAGRWTQATGAQTLTIPYPASFKNPIFRTGGISEDGSTIYGDEFDEIPESAEPFDAFAWNSSTGGAYLQNLNTASPNAYATSISPDGKTVYGYTALPFRVVQWSSGNQAVDISTPNNMAIDAVSGNGLVFSGHNIVWNNTTSFPAPTVSGLTDIWNNLNYDGTIAGGTLEGGTSIPVLWHVGSSSLFYIPLPSDVPSNYSRFFGGVGGIDGTGNVAVGSMTADDPSGGYVIVPFVWDTVHGSRQIGEVLQSVGINTAGWQFQDVDAISQDASTIAGDGYFNGIEESWIAVVPPGTFLPEPDFAISLLILAAVASLGRRSPSRLRTSPRVLKT